MSNAEIDWANDRRHWLNNLKPGDKVFVYMEPNNGGERLQTAIVEEVTLFKVGNLQGEPDDYLRIRDAFVQLRGHDYNGHPLIINALHNSMILEWLGK